MKRIKTLKVVMYLIRRFLPFICLLALLGCSRNEGEATQMQNDTTSQITSLNLRFDHPADLGLQNESDQQARYCMQSELETRYVRCLIFSKNGEIDVGEEYTSLDLTSGATFNYVSQVSNVGSGGEEYQMMGYLTVNDEQIFVKANANERAGFDSAEWALPIIETVRR